MNRLKWLNVAGGVGAGGTEGFCPLFRRNNNHVHKVKQELLRASYVFLRKQKGKQKMGLNCGYRRKDSRHKNVLFAPSASDRVVENPLANCLENSTLRQSVQDHPARPAR